MSQTFANAWERKMELGKYTIIKNMPIPPRQSKYEELLQAVSKMEVGDMVKVETKKEQIRAGSAVRASGYKPAYRLLENGFGVWKTGAVVNGN
jgi:hypothetical protein